MIGYHHQRAPKNIQINVLRQAYIEVHLQEGDLHDET